MNSLESALAELDKLKDKLLKEGNYVNEFYSNDIDQIKEHIEQHQMDYECIEI